MLLPMPEPRKAMLLLWARESGGLKGTNCYCPGVTGERTAFLRQLLLSPSFLIMQKKERQPAQVFFRALPQLGGRSRQALALLPWASKFNFVSTTKKMSELAVLKHRSGSSFGIFRNIIATIKATTN